MDLRSNYNPGPGYYGISRNPEFKDVYKTSFNDYFRFDDEERDIFQEKIRAVKFANGKKPADGMNRNLSGILFNS